MPTFPYTDSAKPLPEEIELREAAMAHGYKLVPIDQPAASEERTQVTDYLLEALPKFLGTAMDADDMREMAKIISDVEALQSVPSSPPALSEQDYNNLVREAMLWRKQKMAAAPSDAGQPRCTTCWALLPCKVHQPPPRTCEEEQD